jgi:uncharacterized protein YjbJ (UPF0337 family)
MVWDEARWDGKIKEKWGKAYPDDAVARRVQDHLDRVQDHLDQLGDARKPTPRPSGPSD